MSDERGRVGQSGGDRGESTSGAAQKRASTHRSILWCLTSGSNAGGGVQVSPAGIAHTFAVCMTEITLMVRGAKKTAVETGKAGMPRFVDVKLSVDQRKDFSSRQYADSHLVLELQKLCDAGYRVGCTWSAETTSYTVSLTCRDEDSENYNLCMTSFAGSIHTAVALALYKHQEVTGGSWLGEQTSDGGFFG
jgi:hypothetical protein